MTIEAVFAYIKLATCKPLRIRALPFEHFFERLTPSQLLRLAAEKFVRIIERLGIHLLVLRHRADSGLFGKLCARLEDSILNEKTLRRRGEDFEGWLGCFGRFFGGGFLAHEVRSLVGKRCFKRRAAPLAITESDTLLSQRPAMVSAGNFALPRGRIALLVVTSMLLSRFVLSTACLLLFADLAFGQTYSNGVAALVQGKPITRSEVRDTVKAQEQIIMAMHGGTDPERMKREIEQTRATALDALIDRELILIEFTKIGGVIKPQYVDDQINNIVREAFKGDRDALVTELAKAGMSIKKFRDMQEKNIIASVMKAKKAGDMPPANPQEVEEYYQNNLDKWRVGDQIKISTISIPKFSGETGATPESQKKLAQEIRSKLLKGGDFATLARSYSQDSRAEFGGAWDWMPRTELDPTIANTAMNLKTGGVSEMLDKETSYIIVACDAKKLGEAPGIEKVRGDIQKMIQQEKSKKAIDDWMAQLRKKAVIRKF